MSLAGASGGSGGGGFGGGGGSWGGGGGGGCGGDGGGKKPFPRDKDDLMKSEITELGEESTSESKSSSGDLLIGVRNMAVAAQDYADAIAQLEPHVAGKQTGLSARVREAQELAGAVATMAAVLEEENTTEEVKSQYSELADKFKDLSTK